MLYEQAVKAWPASFASVTNWAGLLWDRSRERRQQAAALASEGRSRRLTRSSRQAEAGYQAGTGESQPGHGDAAVLRPRTSHPGVAPGRLRSAIRPAPSPSSRRSCAWRRTTRSARAIEEELRRLRAPLTMADRRRHLPAGHLLQHPRELRGAREERHADRRSRGRTLHPQASTTTAFPRGHRLLPARSRHLDGRRVACGLLLAAVEGAAASACGGWSATSRRRCRRSRAASTGGARPARCCSHLAVPFKLRRMGFRGTFYFVDHHTRTPPARFLSRPTSRPRSSPRSVRRGLHDAVRARRRAITSRRIRRFYLPHSLGIFYAALTQFLGYRRQQRRIQGDGPGVLRPAALRRHVCDDGALRRAAGCATTTPGSRSTLGSGTCYSHALRRDVRPACPDEDHVDADPYQRHRGQRPAGARAACSLEMAAWCRDGNGRETHSVPGRRRGAEFRRQRPAARAADLQRHLGAAGRQRRRLRARHPVPHLARTARTSARAS